MGEKGCQPERGAGGKLQRETTECESSVEFNELLFIPIAWKLNWISMHS
jgi:hypothetical protein